MPVITAARASSAIQWGDLPTWVLAVIALAALIAAVAAYFKQADAATKLAEQVTIQRDQLQDQQEASRKQAEVLDAQLREMQQREMLLERQQANDIHIEPSGSGEPPPGTELRPGGVVWAAIVVNRSSRPIRNVDCRIKYANTDALNTAGKIGEIVDVGDSAPGQRTVTRQTARSQVRLMRSSEEWVFTFREDVRSYPGEAQFTLRFTDDAGLYWQIDHDLHLQKLDNRDDW